MSSPVPVTAHYMSVVISISDVMPFQLVLDCIPLTMLVASFCRIHVSQIVMSTTLHASSLRLCGWFHS